MSERFAGAIGLASMTVKHADTAIALGSGDVAVLGTPRLVGLAEAATIAAIADRLDQQETTVGVLVHIEHLGASPVGSLVQASAEVNRVDGSKISFEIKVHDGDRLVARGEITRALVDRLQFTARVAALGANSRP